MVWRGQKAALQSGKLSEGEKGSRAKVLFSGGSFSYHCCNLDPLLQLSRRVIRKAAGQTNHYSHQLYSKVLRAPFIPTVHLSGITEVIAFTKGRKLIFMVSTGPEVDFAKIQ